MFISFSIVVTALAYRFFPYVHFTGNVACVRRFSFFHDGMYTNSRLFLKRRTSIIANKWLRLVFSFRMPVRLAKCCRLLRSNVFTPNWHRNSSSVINRTRTVNSCDMPARTNTLRWRRLLRFVLWNVIFHSYFTMWWVLFSFLCSFFSGETFRRSFEISFYSLRQ